METINFAEQKISLAQTILSLNDIKKISQIQLYVNKLLKKKHDINNEFDAKYLSFNEWNNQFDDQEKLDEYFTEYGMTLREFRLEIYNSEKEKGMSKNEFIGLNRI